MLPELTNFLHVLYVEDDEKERIAITQALKMIFNTVYSCTNGKEALDIYKSGHIDLIIADYAMPILDGSELISAIRRDDKQLPVIIVSGYTNPSQLLNCIPLKLIAYLQKPFKFNELVEAISKAVQEIEENGKLNALICDDVYYDRLKKLAIIDTKTIELSKLECDLLELMLKHKPNIVSKEQICASVFHSSEGVSDNVIKNVIYRLRKKIGKPIIKNIKNIGYALE